MKFTVGRDVFLDALASAVKILPTRSPIPILEAVLLRVEGDRLELRATNMDISLREWVLVADAEEGEVAVPGKRLYDFVSKIKEPSLRFSLRDNTLVYESPKTHGEFRGFPGDEYPVIPELPEAPELRLPLEILKRAINQVFFCAAKDDPRIFLTGLYLDVKPEELRFVASDSTRMGLMRVPADTGLSLGAILDKDALNLVKLLPGDEVGLRVVDDFAYFRHDRGYAAVRLISEPYPDYERVIPEEPGTTILSAERASFLDSLARASVFLEPPLHLLRLTVNPEGLHLEAHSPSGSFEEDLPAEVEGEGLTLSVSGKLLHDIVKAAPGDRLRFHFYSPTSAIRIEPEADDSLLYLLMPVTTQEF